MAKRTPANRLDCGGFRFHGSRLGGCMHGQVLALLGEIPPEMPETEESKSLEELFEAGHESEERTKVKILEAGIPLIHCSSELEKQLALKVEWFDEKLGYNMLITAHPDGVLDVGAQAFNPLAWMAAGYGFHEKTDMADFQKLTPLTAFEHKYFLWKSWDNFALGGLEEFEQYRVQLGIQSEGLRQKFQLDYSPSVVFSVERNLNKGQAAKIILPLPVPPVSFADLQARCREIAEMVLHGWVPPCTKPKWCEYLRGSV